MTLADVAAIDRNLVAIDVGPANALRGTEWHQRCSLMVTPTIHEHSGSSELAGST
jgi:hypothetical protein